MLHISDVSLQYVGGVPHRGMARKAWKEVVMIKRKTDRVINHCFCKFNLRLDLTLD